MQTELVLLPGLLCDRRLWVQQIAGLADVARSSVIDLSTCDSVEEMADVVLHQAPDRFALAGFSMGGCVALEILARALERVRCLALLSTRAAGLLPAVRQHYEEVISNLEAGGMDAYLAGAFPKYVAPEKVRDEGINKPSLPWAGIWVPRPLCVKCGRCSLTPDFAALSTRSPAQQC